MKTADRLVSGFLYLGKLVIFKFQTIAHVNAEGKKSDGNFRNNTGGIVLNKCVIATDINNSTEHTCLLVKTAPGKPGAVMLIKD